MQSPPVPRRPRGRPPGKKMTTCLPTHRSDRIADRDGHQKVLSCKVEEDHLKEPDTWEQMVALPANEQARCMVAVEEEMKSLEDYQVWEETELPPGKCAITAKWVFKAKCDVQGNLCT